MKAMETHAEKAQPLSALCGEEPESRFVGFIIRMNYDRVQVLTNDTWRQRVGGIPQNAILIAAGFEPEALSEAPEIYRFVLAMRVMGPASLHQEASNVAAIIEHHQSKTSAAHAGSLDGMDAWTHGHLQFAGLECKVLGSFYQDHEGHLAYGADIEDYFSVSPMRVFKPTSNALTEIVNYCDPNRRADARQQAVDMGFKEPPAAFEFGKVRYTSTNRLQHSDGTDVPVQFQTADILAKRCGIFGMTRTGKSNLVKTLVGSIALETTKVGGRLGQLILDLNGEYANPNEQDKGAISEVFQDNVVRYRTRAPGNTFFDLRPNFYRSFTTGLETLKEALDADGALKAADMSSFKELEVSPERPNDHREANRWDVKVSAYRCLLHAAQYPVAEGDNGVRFRVGKSVAAQAWAALNDQDAGNEDERAQRFREKYGDPSGGMSLSDARSLFGALRRAELMRRKNDADNIGLRSSSGNPWIEEPVLAMLNLMVSENKTGAPINGINVIARYHDRHSVSGSDNPPGDIHQHLAAGRIVIVDLSLSRPTERTDLMRRIALGLFERNIEIFTRNETPPPFLIYVEEAHNLIGKRAEVDEPWPRVAKEGAKANIGLIYATQEPSTIQSNILANTENMISTHLNNDDEIRALSKYYDFADFEASIKKAQDVGFGRIKRLSAPFVIPVYVHKFEPDKMKAAYEKLGKPEGFTPAPQPAKAAEG